MIKIHCESCGKVLQAPKELAGKRADCPSCGHSVFVPTPAEELKELPLAPEDLSELEHENQLLEERRRLDSLIAREGSSAEDAAPAGAGRAGAGRAGTGGEAASSGTRVEKALTTYLVAMRDSDLAAADRALTSLKLQPRTTKELIDRLAADQIPPPEMANVPPAVYQRLLRNLRSQL